MPIEFKDYYKTLGVARTATDDEIRKAFRKLARQYHPDIAKDKASAEEKFKEINEAYEVLGDPAKRKKYDELGASWNQPGGFKPPPAWQRRGGFQTEGEPFEFHFGGTGFSDFFEQFFSARGERYGFGSFTDGMRETGKAKPFAGRGNDIEGDILVSLDEALRGSVRSVSLQRADPYAGTREAQSFRVRIPPRVQEGQLIRVAGKGEPAPGGGQPGDLYLSVRFAKHPDFNVRNHDLFYDLELAPWEAVLGATVRVPTLEGPISLRIPEGTTHGQQLRARGHGLPAGNGVRGDLYAVVQIQVPSRISDEERRLWMDLARGSGFKPRKT